MLNSGAAGFVLSRGSLALLQEAWGVSEIESRGRVGSAPGAAMVEGGGGGARGDGGGDVKETISLNSCVAKSRFERDNPGEENYICIDRKLYFEVLCFRQRVEQPPNAISY